MREHLCFLILGHDQSTFIPYPEPRLRQKNTFCCSVLAARLLWVCLLLPQGCNHWKVLATKYGGRAQVQCLAQGFIPSPYGGVKAPNILFLTLLKVQLLVYCSGIMSFLHCQIPGSFPYIFFFNNHSCAFKRMCVIFYPTWLNIL